MNMQKNPQAQQAPEGLKKAGKIVKYKIRRRTWW
jgi:hypothetical protein